MGPLDPVPGLEGHPRLGRLFEGSFVVVEEARIPAEMPRVLPEESIEVAHAVLRRQIEFATGRWCARRALARLDIESFVLRNGPDRAPRWPEGVVGSITHTGAAPGGYCGVVVARSSEIKAIGIDAESSDALDASLWSSVLTRAERIELASNNGSNDARENAGDDGMDAGRKAKLIFAAKECFYKAQYPLSGRFLSFGDVEVRVDLGTSTFSVRVLDAGRDGHPLVTCSGRYLMEDGLVLTGVAVPA
jgi:4'-phosphopantetheinyl transferase EntD